MSNNKAPRDFGLSVTAATAILGVCLLVAGSQWPDVIWDQQLDHAVILVAGLAIVSSLGAALAMGSKPLYAEAAFATALTLVFYCAVQGISYYNATAGERQVASIASRWPLLISQNYRHFTDWTPKSSGTSAFGTETTDAVDGQFILTLTSDRDETDLVGPDGKNQPTATDFFLQADVDYMGGPQDGYCVLIFGFTKSEHWWALKVGDQNLAITQDNGGLPHRYIYGPESYSAFTEQKPHHVVIFKQAGQVEAFVNHYRAISLDR